jgi:hypothetical protein
VDEERDLMHTHEWTKTERDWACTECPETSATCGTCGGPSGGNLLLCKKCRKHADRVLDDIAHAIELWQPALGRDDGVTFRASAAIHPDERQDIDERLWGWVARWSEHTGASNADWIDYLKTHHLWAAHNPEASDWHEYLHDVKQLRRRARGEAGLLPQTQPEPCVHCGGEVVRDWADKDWNPLPDGLSDHVRCTGCAMTWPNIERWRFITRQHIVASPLAHPDALVTLEQARMIFPDVPVSTMRSWVRRDAQAWGGSVGAVQEWWQARRSWLEGTAEDWRPWREAGWTLADLDAVPDLHDRALPEHGQRQGEALYRVGDLHARAIARVDDTRRGPKVA